MQDLLWFLSGCAATLATVYAITAIRRRRTRDQQPPSNADDDAPQDLAPRRYVLNDSRCIEDLSAALGQDLSTLASAVEGQAQLLCESLGAPTEFAKRAEQLWESVRRLRFFCEKMQAFSTIPDLALEPTDIRRLLGALASEIEDYSSGCLQVGLQTAPSLPLALSNPSALRTAVLFLIEGVLDLEPDANSLLLQAQSHESADDVLSVRIDIEAVIDGHTTHHETPPVVHLSYLAARNLLEAQEASFTLDHTPGLNAIASIALAATHQVEDPIAQPVETTDGAFDPELAASAALPDREPTPVLATPPLPAENAVEIPLASRPSTDDPTERPHQFGGVLIVESNPAIRDMLARELGRAGRNVVACADGVAARTLFDATPERFELLVLERESRRMRGEDLARIALADHPHLRVLLIHPGPGISVAADLIGHEMLASIHKPFGLMELRNSLTALIDVSPASFADDVPYAPSQP